MRTVDVTAPDVPPEMLLQRVAAQDRAAFQALFIHFAPRLKAWLMRSGTQPGEAEDFAQDAMLTVWRKAAQFDPAKASAATWIFTIARNLRIDHARRRRHPGFDHAALLPDHPVQADEGLAARQDARILLRALSSLPPDQVQAVMLSFFSDKPHSQIAAELGIPLGTVKSRIRLGMGRLKLLLGEGP